VVLITYYFLKQTTPVNYIGLAKLPSFRNSDASISSTRITAIGRIPPRVEFTEHSPTVEDIWASGRNVKFSDVTGYNTGKFSIPDHNMKSGKLWYYTVGSCSTAGVAGAYSHSLFEADTLPFLGFHGELEHVTTANNHIVDLLGVVCKESVLTFGQDHPTTHSHTYEVSYALTGSNVARDTTLDFEENYLPGAWIATLQFNSTTTNFTILSGQIRVKNTVEFDKSNSTYPTSVTPLKREYTIRLEGVATAPTLLNLPRNPADYSDSKITFEYKCYKGASSATDFMRFSFNSLRMDKMMAEKIDETMYRWKGNIVLHNAGARNASTSAGTMVIKIEDNLSANHYER
jgi:hypothetical protein